MCAPATAALLLAALTALPCQGTDADDATSRLLNATLKLNKTKTTPTLNKVYQMLYSSDINVYNQTKLFNNFNHSNLNLKHNLNFANHFEPSSSNTYVNNNLHVNIVDNQKLPGDAKLVVNKEDMNTKKVKRKRSVSVVRSDDNPSNTKSNNSAEVTTMVTSQSVMERRRKPGETGSSAPLLNYIFDTYSNTHQHHSRSERPGNGNSIYAAAAPEIKALVGSTAHLDCKVDALHDKLVSWVRRKSDEEPMELLTTGTQQYTADDRYSARFIPPDIWRLEVRDVRPSDGANYDCQLSAHPPRTARVALYVPEVSVRIVDGAGAEVSEQVCEIGSTVALRCEVRGLRMEGGPALLWYRREDLLNDDTTRGGISVRTEFGENGANSVLRVARVRSDDAGRYMCRVAHTPPVILPPAHVMLHVIKGESLAELHQGVGTTTLNTQMFIVSLVFAVNACT